MVIYALTLKNLFSVKVVLHEASTMSLFLSAMVMNWLTNDIREECQ